VAPLLAVCGVCGGAGTTTLSYLVARSAIDHARGHVLVCDTGGPTAGLAACAGVESPRTLVEIAGHVERSLPLVSGIYAVDEHVSTTGSQLRVIAAGPRLADDDDTTGFGRLLAMARSDGAHALTVVDCGTLQRDTDRLALAAASHVAWVLPATRTGARRAERLLAAMQHDPPGRELIVARRDDREPRATLRALRALAERRRAPLVLLPQLGDVVERPQQALAEAQVSLQAIHGVLQR
jgi:MinD-like ATPase involved in chromosome partitioning or flagellar assembly